MEIVMSVPDDFKGDFEDARCYVPTEKVVREQVRDYLELAGRKREESRRIRVVGWPEFIEFDSGNPGHANAYYGGRFAGPGEIINAIEGWMTNE